MKLHIVGARLEAEIIKLLLFPSSRGGVDATSKKYRRRHPLIGADGVVRNFFDHPVCASKVASQRFLDAQPPLLERRGIAAEIRFRLLSKRPLARVQLTVVFCPVVPALRCSSADVHAV